MQVIILTFEVMFVLYGIVEIIFVYFEKHFGLFRNSLSEIILNK